MKMNEEGNENKGYLFVDAETDGLYGKFISIAMVLTDSLGKELEYRYMGIGNPEQHIKSEWVKENVLPVLGQYEEFPDEESLLEACWQFWRKHADNTYVVADVIHPIESRLFTHCVKCDEENRMFQGPYPLLDLSSMLYVAGIDPLVARESLCGDSENKGNLHNALYDARLTASIWKEYILPHRFKHL